jgi:hypothetical protein
MLTYGQSHAAYHAEKKACGAFSYSVAKTLIQKSPAHYLAETKERRKAAAPDKEKLAELARAIRELPIPQLASACGLLVEAQICEQVQKFAAWVDKKAGEL